MVALPEQGAPTVDAIYRSYEDREAQSRRRAHLGGSEIGRTCSRELWYRFRWALRPSFEGRMLRLFRTGHREEERLLEELRIVGVEVTDRDETGRQWRVSALGGHFAGSMDGAALGLKEAPKTWHLLEFKTSNAKRFKELKKKGVQRAKPEHYAQMQVYMGLAKLSRAAYFSVCKDTDEIYLERVKYDRPAFVALMDRARQIITSPEPLARASMDPFGPPCGFCDFASLCHEDAVPDVNCRTCAHATPVVDESDTARWTCERHGHDLSPREQEAACNDHLYIPALVPYAEPVDAGQDHVLYQIRKKPEQRFVNVASTGFPGADVPHFSSKELRVVPPDAIGNELLEETRKMFGGTLERTAE